MAAPELRLAVGLDLTLLRQQISTIGTQLGGQPISLRTQFDKRSIQAQYAAISRQFAKKTFRIEVASNLEAEIRNAENLIKALDRVKRAASTAKTSTPIGTGPFLKTKTKGGLDAAEIKRLYEALAMAGVEGFEAGTKKNRPQMVAQMGAVSRDVIAGLLNGLKSKDPQVQKAAQSLGQTLIASVKRTLGIASPSKEFEEIGKDVGRGFEKGVLSSMDAAFNALESKMRQRVRVLDTFARGVFRMLGMDPVQLAAERRQRLAPPAINWPAQTPPRQRPDIGPSSTGRALPPGANFAALPGTSFAEQKRLVGDILSPSLKEALRGAANAFVDSVRAELNAAVRSVSVQDLGARAKAITGTASVPLLPAAGGTGGPLGGNRRGGGGYVPPGGFPSDGMAQGSQGPKNMLSLDYYRNAVRYSEALKVATESTRNFSASQLPFVGGIRALGGELAMATKQVLLYGTAYKALAFVSSLPGQLINAAKGQQQFNNALQVATQDTNTFAKELLFVDNVQRAFGLNLETTRTGFTRLYASMAPANFDSGSIEKLFTGISAATAALQLTPDKAERVTYAFSQMASKGQIMAEELRGQLGDVLPGALSIFAKAAGMSIKDFSKAMEDGEFTGNRFREVFAKVSDELLNRFGTGAQAAGKSLQGLTNVVQSDFLRSLEALSPLADAAAKAILQPASSFLKQFQLSAKIATGELYRLEGQVSDAKKVVDELKIGGGDPQEIKAAEQSLAALQARYQALSQAAQDPAVMKQSEDIRRFTEELAKAGTVVMNIARAIGATLSPILSFLGGNLTTVVGTIVAFYTGFQAARLAALALMGALLAYRALSAILGFGPAALQAAALAKAFNVLGVSAGRASIQLIGVRTALMALTATTVIGLVVTGITLIAGAFGTMRDRAREAADASRDAARSAVEAARSGNVAQAAMSVQEILSQSRGDTTALKALESIYARSTEEQRARGAAPMVISAEEAVALEGSRLTQGMIKQVRNGKREIRVPTVIEMAGLRRQFGSQAGMHKVNLEQAKVAQEQAQQVATTAGFNQPSLPPALPESVDDKEKAKKEKDAEELAKRQQALAERAADQQQQLILKTAEHRARLMELGYEAERDLTNERFEEAKRLIDYEYDYRLARANEVQSVQLNLEKKLAQARINSLRAVSERGLMLREAQMKVDTAKAQRVAASQVAAIPVTTAMQATTGAGESSTASTITPYERALLDTIAFAEGTYNRPNSGYQTMFTGRQFSDLTRHPRMINRGGGYASDAAGRYQFLSTTWNSLGLGAFTPQNQDIGALMLARRRGVNPATPLTRAGIDKLSPEWASFPTLKTGTSYYGQGGKSFGELERFYSQRLAAYSGRASMSGPSFSMEKREQGIEFNVEGAQAEQKVKTAIADLQLMNKVLEEARNASLAIGEAIGQALPTEQIKLDNQVLAERNRLILAGVPSEAIESAERLTRARGNYASIETAINNEIEKAEANLKLYDSQLANNTLSADEHAKATKTLNDLLALHRKELASLPAALREFETETLKATLAQLKQADALKAVEEATAMVNSAVEGVVSSYKDLFVDIMSGGDIKEAAKKMQESLSKQVFTMFIDFSMKPVEKFFKDQLLSIFGLPNEESKRAEVIAQMERQIAALDRNTAALQSPGTGTGIGAAAPSSLIPAGAGFGNLEAVGKAGELAQGATEKLFELPAAMSSLTQASENITANFAQATGALVQQSQAGAVAASAWQQNLGKTVSAVGIAASSIMGITAGVSQIKEGGISGVLGGIGSIAMSMGSLLGGFGGLGIFGGGGTSGGSGMPWNFNSPVKLFANGGVVNGPTLGMVGEGRYSEAIVPLPDGRSIPVKMSDQSASLRDAMNTMSPLTAMAPILSMKFETTNIGGVEYVSRDQLEAAMATTRRQAAKDGAMRGMNMTLDKIQQSPATRGRLGMRRG